MFLLVFIPLSMAVFPLSGAEANTGPRSFSYEGRLYDSAGDPSAETVSFRIQLLNPALNCVLFEETTPTQNLSLSSGYFHLRVGMSTPVFGNLRAALSNSALISGKASCSYMPAADDGRRMRVSVIRADASEIVMQQAVDIAAAPYAMVADSLQGKTPAGFVNVNAEVTQAKVETPPGAVELRGAHSIDSRHQHTVRKNQPAQWRYPPRSFIWSVDSMERKQLGSLFDKCDHRNGSDRYAVC
jgi:hypothetical protein